MKTLKIKIGKGYGIIIGSGVFDYLFDLCERVNKVLLVSDNTVYGLYGKKISKVIEKSGSELYTFLFPDGEDGKSKFIFDKLVTDMISLNLNKGDLVISLGGGAVSDTVGFACSIYKRGIPFINVPTTLLSMADASIGGKTAINHLGVKNVLGSFYQPSAVLMDTDFLKTLNKEQINDGLVEIIKSAVIGDKKLFNKFESGEIDIEDALFRAVSVKKKYVEKDVFDTNLRKVLNFGHTIGHAIESVENFKVSHGKAVAIGMIKELEILEKLGFSLEVKDRLVRIYGIFEINTDYLLKEEDLFGYIINDKKVNGDYIYLPVPKRIGKCVNKKIKIKDIKNALL